jgi:hypothetical protein
MGRLSWIIPVSTRILIRERGRQESESQRCEYGSRGQSNARKGQGIQAASAGKS